MSKYHVNTKNGNPSPCRAKKSSSCPFSGDSGTENHYDFLEDAQKAGEKLLSSRHGATSKRINKIDLPSQEKKLLETSQQFIKVSEENNKSLDEYDDLVQRIELAEEDVEFSSGEQNRREAENNINELEAQLRVVSDKRAEIIEKYSKAEIQQANAFRDYVSIVGSEEAYRKLNSGQLGTYYNSKITSDLIKDSVLPRNKHKDNKSTRIAAQKTIINTLRLAEENELDDLSEGYDMKIHSMKYTNSGKALTISMVGDEDQHSIGEATLEVRVNPDGSFDAFGETTISDDSEGEDFSAALLSVGHFAGAENAPNIIAASFMNVENDSQELSHWARRQSPILYRGQQSAYNIINKKSDASYVRRESFGDFAIISYDGHEIGKIIRGSDEARSFSSLNSQSFADLRHEDNENTLSLLKLSGNRP